MSARKRATISLQAADYERQHKEEMAMLFSSLTNSNDTRHMRDQLNLSMHEMEKRQQDFEKVISSFNANVADMEYQTSIQMNQQQSELYQTMGEVAGNLFDQTSVYLQNELDRIQECIDVDNQVKQVEIQAIRNEILQEKGDKELLQTEIISTINMIRSMQDFIFRNYDIERFAGKDFTDIHNRVQDVETLYEKQLYEAAYLTAFQTYQRISELRIDLEKQQNQWSVLRNRVLLGAKKLQQIGKDNRVIQPVDIEGNVIPDSPGCHVNFWTEGEYQNWLDEVKSILQTILTDSPLVSMVDLEYYNREKLPELRVEFENLIKSARLKILNSQIRVNIASIISWALSEQGYTRQKSEYIECDERLGFEVIVSNHENSQVTIHIDPDTNQKQSVLEIETKAANPYSEHELRRRNYEIIQSLRKYGLNVGEIKTLSETGTPTRESYPRRAIRSDLGRHTFPTVN